MSRFEDCLAVIQVEVGRILAGVEPDLAVSIATIRQAADDLHRVAGSDTACPSVTHINGQLAPEYNPRPVITGVSFGTRASDKEK